MSLRTILTAAALATSAPTLAQSPPRPAAQPPSVAPQPQVPAAVPAQPTPGPPAQPRHVLSGEWRIGWPNRQGAINVMTFEGVSAVQGGLAVDGRVIADNGESCPMTGAIYDEFSGQVRDGLDTRTVNLSTLVRLRIRCANDETWIEAFGLPGGPISMAGRATTLLRDGARTHQPVQIGR